MLQALVCSAGLPVHFQKRNSTNKKEKVEGAFGEMCGLASLPDKGKGWAQKRRGSISSFPRMPPVAASLKRSGPQHMGFWPLSTFGYQGVEARRGFPGKWSMCALLVAHDGLHARLKSKCERAEGP